MNERKRVMENSAKVGFIGFGNMAGAICDGLLAKEAVKPENMYACARDMDRLRAKPTSPSPQGK